MFKERDSFLSAQVAHSHSLAIQRIQKKIKSLYQELLSLELKDELRANELILDIRRLERKLIDARMAQPGHYL